MSPALRAMAEAPLLLVLRALGIGDLLTAFPALRALRRSFPDHRLVLAAPPFLEPMALLSGAVDEVAPSAPLAPLPRPTLPDMAVNLHGRGPESHRILLALRPRMLVAFAHDEVPESTGGPAWRDGEHEVARWCRLLRQFGIDADEDDLALERPDGRAPVDVTGATLLHPRAATRARDWSIEGWTEVARAERARGHRVFVTGSDADREVAQHIARRAGLGADHVLAGRLGLLDLVRTVADAGRIVSVDTSVGHLATALGTPSVILFGPTPPSAWGPPADRPWHRALWAGRVGDPLAGRPDPSMALISAEQVVRALADLPGRPPDPARSPAGASATR